MALSHSWMVPSPLPMARVVLSGLNATEVTVPVGLVKVAIWSSVAVSHNWTVPSPRPAARIASSGLNATELTAPAEPLSRTARVGVVRQLHGEGRPHNQTPSALPAARVAPSGLNATELTGPVGAAGRLRPGRWLATSHNRALASAPPVARVVPSGRNATDLTGPVGPVSAAI